MATINVTSEIGKLKKIMLHRPGNELLLLTPDSLQELLFDDIPFLKIAQKEHDAFAAALKQKGIDLTGKRRSLWTKLIKAQGSGTIKRGDHK